MSEVDPVLESSPTTRPLPQLGLIQNLSLWVLWKLGRGGVAQLRGCASRTEQNLLAHHSFFDPRSFKAFVEIMSVIDNGPRNRAKHLRSISNVSQWAPQWFRHRFFNQSFGTFYTEISSTLVLMSSHRWVESFRRETVFIFFLLYTHMYSHTCVHTQHSFLVYYGKTS